MKRRQILLSVVAMAALQFPAWAQRTEPPRRIGVLRAARDDAGFRQNFAPFLPALRERGFVPDANLAIEYRVRAGDSDEILSLANELVRARVDAILAIAAPSVTAAARATAAIPIVAVDLESDPIASGFARNLSRPGGNVTGLFLDFPEMSGKWLQQLKEVMPKLSRAAVLWDPAVGPYLLRGAEAAAASMNIRLTRVEARGAADLTRAFDAAVRSQAEALLALSSPVFVSVRKEIAELALKHRLPAIMPFPQFADEGGMMAYGPHLTTMFRQAGEVMARILQGAHPRDIPIERPSRFELVINLKSARALSVSIPQSLLVRADKVIE